jgi:uncharacterized protein YodC (DUF2158 family)
MEGQMNCKIKQMHWWKRYLNKHKQFLADKTQTPERKKTIMILEFTLMAVSI